MSFQEALQSALIQNYANFRGRALRSEYWYFGLALFVATIVALVIDINMIGRPILKSVVTLGTIIPSLSVGARRLHDTDRSGWWQLIGVVPLIGAIVLIVWFASARSAGDNRFGKPPQGQRPVLI
jgi:uncharacterized membrane protein YhaH (DUF805 family)